MPSITSWMRLEPRCRNAEMTTSLQARIYDPLWLLARQWQLGEFQGEDNGSPIIASWRAETARLTRFHSGAIKPDTITKAPAYDGRVPLETVVERETIHPTANQTGPEKLRLAAESGQQFLRMLQHQPLSRDYSSAFIKEFQFVSLTPDQRAALDGDSLNFFDLIATRVPDGRRLYASFRPNSSGDIVLPASLQIAVADLAEIEKAARLWSRWVETLFTEPEADRTSWLSERLEYAFSVGSRLSDREYVLTATEYSEGHLDWYAFDSNLEVTLGGAQDDAVTETNRKIIPAPVSFRGMPAARFWEFEDAQVDFGSVDAGPTDLARLLLVEFAIDFGNDWFVIPVELEIGSICRTKSLIITDTFGVQTLIKSNSEAGDQNSIWRMFQISHTRGSGLPKPEPNLFFLPPSLISGISDQPIEEVLFLRDEMANLAWAVERVVESPTEGRINRFEAYLDHKRKGGQQSPPTPPATPQTMRYRLSTEVPDYWVPLLPVKTEDGLRLRRGAVLKTDGTNAVVHPLGRILVPGNELSFFEEEVPREGVRVTRSYQFTRWIDGSSHLWVGRRKGVGLGEGSSGLKFDSLV